MAEEKSSGCSPESCSSCAHAGSCSSAKKDLKAPANPYSQVKKVIGVVSGKGGVGKSMVTASLARMMVQQGYSVGILDADITGPSIPKMYGVHGSAVGSEAGMFPCVAKDGTKIMSVNLLLEHESDPVIWRGPVIAGVVTQFWTDVMWGDLDFLFVDMPPGTGCSSYGIPVTSGRRRCDRDFATGSGTDDRRESLQYGKEDEHTGSRTGGKLQLSGMSGLWKENICIWGKPH